MIHLDTGKREKHKSYQADAPIKLPHGSQFVTVPIRKDGFLPMNQTGIEYSNTWQQKHLRTIQMAYQRAPYFSEIFPEVVEIISKKYRSLAELNITTTLWGISRALGLKMPFNNLTVKKITKILKKSKTVRLNKIILDSELGLEEFKNSGKPNEWIVKICNSVGADELFHGETSKAGYMDLDYFKKNGIVSVVQKWKLKEYPQQFEYRTDFLPNLSILDLLFNVNQKTTLSILAMI